MVCLLWWGAMALVPLKLKAGFYRTALSLTLVTDGAMVAWLGGVMAHYVR